MKNLHKDLKILYKLLSTSIEWQKCSFIEDLLFKGIGTFAFQDKLIEAKKLKKELIKSGFKCNLTKKAGGWKDAYEFLYIIEATFK